MPSDSILSVYPIFFVTSQAPGEKFYSHVPQPKLACTQWKPQQVAVVCNGPLHGGRCLGNPVEVKLHPVEGQAFLEICQCLTQQMNPFKSFQKNSKTDIATYYHIIVIYVFVLFCFHICSLLGFQGVQVFSFVLFLFLTLLMSK